MKKILIAYTSRAGNTEQMAGYMAEGVRMSGAVHSLQFVSDGLAVILGQLLAASEGT